MWEKYSVKNTSKKPSLYPVYTARALDWKSLVSKMSEVFGTATPHPVGNFILQECGQTLH